MSVATSIIAGNAAPAVPGPGGGTPATVSSSPAVKAASAQAGDTLTLSPQAQALLDKLKARDADVRAHEAAHVAAGGDLITSGVTFSYETGPDGRAYAVGGDVSIDTSPVSGNPQATIAKAQQIIAAALAPADPSGQDLAVAGAAAAMEAQASAQASSQTNATVNPSTQKASASGRAAIQGYTGGPSVAQPGSAFSAVG